MPGDDEPQVDFTRDVSRRQMMRVGGGLAVFGIAAPAEGSFTAEDFDVTPLTEMQEVDVDEQGLEDFTIRQARVVHDLTARIYPSDENGPGAPEAGVVYFIDRQMNSAWGRGERWYMQGPFAGKDPTDPFEDEAEEPADISADLEVPWADTTPAQTQGWQYPITPNEAYDQGIHALEEYAQAEYDADSFTGLEGDQQDEVVSALQDDEVESFDDLNGDNFDHSDLDFLHGGNIALNQTGDRPIANNPVPEGTQAWGSEFKEQSLEYYHSSVSIACQGASLPFRENYLDLDPNYTDQHGQPLLRMTFDWREQDRNLVEHIGPQLEEITEEMGADRIRSTTTIDESFDIVPYQSTHNTGGAIMGSDPDESVVNNYLQAWDAHNLFIPGASAFAHNSGYNPTGTVGALAFRAADGIEQYLESPELLADA